MDNKEIIIDTSKVIEGTMRLQYQDKEVKKDGK